MAVDSQKLELARQRLVNDLQNPVLFKSYLLELQTHQAVYIDLLDTKETVEIPLNLAWQIIENWLHDTESNLSYPEHASIKAKASALIDSLDRYQETIRTAASAQTARRLATQDVTATPEIGLNSFQQALAAERSFIKAYNDHFLNPLSNKLADSPFLRHISNPFIRKQIALQLAANWTNLLSGREDSELARGSQLNEISQLFIHSASPERNNLARILRTEQGEKEATILIKTIESEVKSHYQVDGRFNSKNAYKDALQFAKFTFVGTTLTQTSNLIESATTNLTAKDRLQLAQTIRQEILRSVKSQHLTGQEVITAALNRFLPMSDNRAEIFWELQSQLAGLAPQIEATEVTIRSAYLGNSYFEKQNSRLLASSRLTDRFGLNPFIPWIKTNDLEQAKKSLLTDYGVSTIEEAIAIEKGSSQPDYSKLSALFVHLDYEASYKYYQQLKKDNTFLATEELLVKTMVGVRELSDSYYRFTRRVWSAYDKVDDIISYPSRALADAYDALSENGLKLSLFGRKLNIPPFVIQIRKTRIPLLNLPGFALDQWIRLQKRAASGIFRFARSGSRFSSPFWRGVAAYSKAFVHSDASFGRANFLLLERGWGNLLNWGARRAGHASWSKLKLAIGTKLWEGFGKLAPGFAKKFAGTVIEKIVTTLGFASLTGGTSLLIQAGLMVVGHGIKSIIRFFRDADFRNRILNFGPWIAGMIGGAVVAFQGFGITIAGALALASSTIAGAIGTLILLTAAGLASAFLWTVILFLSAGLLFNAFKMTTHIDSGAALFASIFCSQDGSSSDPNITTTPTTTGTASGNSVLSCANCLVDYLLACYGPSTDINDMQTTGIGCLIAKAVAPAAADAIEQSARGNTYLQCVGFVRAAIACAGGSIESKNACSYTAGAAGYQFVSGLNGASPGDPIVFDSSGTCSSAAPGHIGIMSQDAGALICLADANYNCDGCPNKNNCLPKSGVAGYLRKI